MPPEQYAALRKTQIAEAKPLADGGLGRVQGARAHEPGGAARAGRDQAGRAARTTRRSGSICAASTAATTSKGIGYTIGGTTGPRALIIEPREKSWGPDYLRFGLGLESDFKGDNQFNVLFEYRKTWLNRLGGEWLTQFQIGQNTYIGTEFYQPVEESGRWFVQPYALAGQQTRGVFVGDDKVADYRIGTVQGGNRRRGRARHLGPAQDGAGVDARQCAGGHGLAGAACGEGADRRASARSCSSIGWTKRGSRPTASPRTPRPTPR